MRVTRAHTQTHAQVYWDFTGFWITLVFMHGGAVLAAWLYKSSFRISPMAPSKYDSRKSSKSLQYV